MAMTSDIALMVPPPPLVLEGMWRFRRPAGFTARAQATRHHLIHLVESGGYRLRLAGRTWEVGAPALIWYHGGEAVDWIGDQRSVVFASCPFACPGLAPPPAGARVVAAAPQARTAFAALFAAAAGEDLRAHLRLHASACAWLVAMLDAFGLTEASGVWDRVERHACALGRTRVADLAEWAGVGISTLERSCWQRHGCSPGRRLRQLRLAHAEALISQGALSAAQAALRLGWSDRRSLRRARRKTIGS